MTVTTKTVSSGYSTGTINENFQTLEDYINNNLLNRDGTSTGEVNQLELSLDMNSNFVFNLPEPVLEHQAARLQDVQNAIAGSDSANLITFTPYGNIASGNVQGALQEIVDGTGQSVTTSTGTDQTLVSALDDRLNIIDGVIYVEDIAARDALTGLADGQSVKVKEDYFYTWDNVNSVFIKDIGQFARDNVSQIDTPQLFDMHFKALKGVGWVTGESGGTVSMLTTASASAGDMSLSVDDPSSLVAGQLICYEATNGFLFSTVVQSVSGSTVNLRLPIEASVANGADVFNFYDDFSHPNAEGFRCIIDYSIVALRYKERVEDVWEVSDGYTTSGDISAVTTNVNEYRNPGSTTVDAVKVDFTPDVASTNLIETHPKKVPGGSYRVHLPLTPGWGSRQSVKITVLEVTPDGTKYALVNKTVESNQAISIQDLYVSVRSGAKLSIRLEPVGTDIYSFVLGPVTFSQILGKNAQFDYGTHAIFGDSWVARAYIIGRLRERLPNATIVNLGQGGDRSDTLVGRYSDVEDEDPDYVWTVVGTNDYYSGGASGYELDFFQSQLNILRGRNSGNGFNQIWFTSSVGQVDFSPNNKLDLSRQYALFSEYCQNNSYSDEIVPISSSDSSGLTVYEGNVVSVTADSYSTVFDVSEPTELLSGSLFGNSIGARLTVDGEVIFDLTGAANGRDNAGDLIGFVTIPPAKCRGSMKLEAYNRTASSQDYGWRVFTR